MANTVKLLNKTSLLISVLKTSLTSISNNSESRFIELGRDLQSVYSDAEALAQSVLDAAGMIKGEYDDNLLSDIGSFAKESLNKLESFRSWLSVHIDNTMKKTSNSASNISNYILSMQDISMDLHIKALNALIMSKKLGASGTTLSVLAQHVTEVSKNSDDFVIEVIDILKSIQASEKDLNGISLKLNDGSYYGCKKDSTLGDGINAISHIYDRFIKKTEDAYLHSMDLKERLVIVGSSLAFLDQMKSGIKECIERMNGLVKELSPYMEKDRNEGGLNTLKDRYTMEVERNIHQRSMEADDNLSDNNAPDMNFEGLGDNVELF